MLRSVFISILLLSCMSLHKQPTQPTHHSPAISSGKSVLATSPFRPPPLPPTSPYRPQAPRPGRPAIPFLSPHKVRLRLSTCNSCLSLTRDRERTPYSLDIWFVLINSTGTATDVFEEGFGIEVLADSGHISMVQVSIQTMSSIETPCFQLVYLHSSAVLPDNSTTPPLSLPKSTLPLLLPVCTHTYSNFPISIEHQEDAFPRPGRHRR